MFSGMVWPSLGSLAWAQSVNCGQLFQAKKYLTAAECFQKKASKMPSALQLSKIQRYLKGQTIRNASLAFQKAASLQQNIEVAAYRREQAVRMLRQYLKEDLCQKKYLCRQARGNILELLHLIKYTPLSIITAPGQRATVKVTGYQYKIQHISPPQWNKSVRPGRFRIEVRYENGKVVRKQVIVSPGQARTVTLLGAVLTRKTPTPLKVQRRSSAVPWIVLASGLVLAGSGGALLGLGVTKTGERDKLAKDLAQEAANKNATERLAMVAANETQTRIKQMDNAHQTAATTLPMGWTLAGVGLATVATSIVLFFVMQPKAAPKTTTLPTHSQTSPMAHILTQD